MTLSKAQYLFALFWLLAAAEPYATFHTTCSSPISSVRFVSAPDTRGTLQILWGTLFTIFACTWTIQHPNVPEQRDGRCPGWKGDLHWGLKSLYDSVIQAICTIIAPEIIVVTAVVDLIAARESSRKLCQMAKDDGVPWTITHSFYADMGAYVIRTSGMEDNTYHDPYHLTAANICDLRHKGYLEKIPQATEEELHDKSKSDPLLKAITIGQILWSIIQIIARGFRNLTISPLELSVVAFATCAIVIYALYWKKPKSVRTPITIVQYQGSIPSQVLEILKSSRPTPSLVRQYLFPRNSTLRSPTLDGSPIHNMSQPWPDMNWTILSAAGSTAAAIFGGIHCAAWNFVFPSTAELVAWRCASIYTAIFGLLASFWFGVFDGFLPKRAWDSTKTGKIYDLMDWGIMCLTYLYIAARLFILVEAFRTLFYLPPDAFVSTWTSSIPHFS